MVACGRYLTQGLQQSLYTPASLRVQICDCHRRLASCHHPAQVLSCNTCRQGVRLRFHKKKIVNGSPQPTTSRDRAYFGGHRCGSTSFAFTYFTASTPLTTKHPVMPAVKQYTRWRCGWKFETCRAKHSMHSMQAHPVQRAFAQQRLAPKCNISAGLLCPMSSHSCLPLRHAPTICRPLSAASRSRGAIPLMTLSSSATVASTIFRPGQYLSAKLLSSKHHGASGMLSARLPASCML